MTPYDAADLALAVRNSVVEWSVNSKLTMLPLFTPPLPSRCSTNTRDFKLKVPFYTWAKQQNLTVGWRTRHMWRAVNIPVF